MWLKHHLMKNNLWIEINVLEKDYIDLYEADIPAGLWSSL